jgi:hypothetical protein
LRYRTPVSEGDVEELRKMKRRKGNRKKIDQWHAGTGRL